MAVIAQTSLSQLGAFNPTETTLTGTDTLVYTKGTNQILTMRNTTASPVTVTLDGSTGTTVPLASVGAGSSTLTVSAGLAIVVPASGTSVVRLDTIFAYLQGTVNVTGTDTAIIAHILA